MTGRVEEAHTSYLEALGAARTCGALRIETLAIANLAFAAVERGDHESALLRFAQARTLTERIGDPLLRTKVLTREASCAVLCDHIALAEASAVEAEGLARLVGDRQAAVEVHLVRADIARLRGQVGLARTLLEEALALAMNAGRPRTLTQVRERLDALAAADVAPPQGTLQVGVGAYWFEPPSGPRVDLKTRPPLRRVLSYLIDLRLTRPGVAATTNELAAAGWPGEQLLTESAADRVYTAVGTLRKMGLATVLIRSDGGYILEPTLPTIVV
jgi:hypothetical protein